MADEDSQPTGRRFLHRSRVNRGKLNRKHEDKGDSFQPRNMLGRFSVRSTGLHALNNRFNPSFDADSEMWLEIHELVESQTGFLATFDLGVVNGVMLIAGSRKALRNVVDEMEIEDEDEDDDEDEEENDESSQNGSSMSDTEAAKSTDDESSAEQELEKGDGEIDTFERPPELDRANHAFEKNTFRTPKWFTQWRGQVKSRDDRDNNAANGEDRISNGMYTSTDCGNKAHFEFTSSACREFSATFSLPDYELKDLVLRGWKVTNKASTTSRKWSDFNS